MAKLSLEMPGWEVWTSDQGAQAWTGAPLLPAALLHAAVRLHCFSTRGSAALLPGAGKGGAEVGMSPFFLPASNSVY